MLIERGIAKEFARICRRRFAPERSFDIIIPMTITLGPETQRLLEDQLKSGNYANPDEVLQAALQALGEFNELDQATLDAIDISEEEIERGEVLDWDDVREEIRTKFRGG